MVIDVFNPMLGGAWPGDIRALSSNSLSDLTVAANCFPSVA